MKFEVGDVVNHIEEGVLLVAATENHGPGPFVVIGAGYNWVRVCPMRAGQNTGKYGVGRGPWMDNMVKLDPFLTAARKAVRNKRC